MGLVSGRQISIEEQRDEMYDCLVPKQINIIGDKES